MHKIFIFHDFVHHAAALYFALKDFFGAEAVRYVNAAEIHAGILSQKPDLFVMPGGASRYGQEKLGIKGFAAIKDYIAKGGRYMGICGGAYSACTKILWAEQTEHEISVDGALRLFNGCATGPVQNFSSAHSRNGSAARVVKLEHNGKFSPTLYWGGCVFVPHTNADYQIVARYADLPQQPAAIIAGTHKQGRWLLSSPHIEFNTDRLSLAQFNVIDNAYDDLAALGTVPHLNEDVFELCLTQLGLQF